MSVIEQSPTTLLPKVERRRSHGMGLGEAFRIAAQGLLANKLRSFLTMLGIIIGVGAVIVMVGLAQGAAKASEESIRKLGTNVLTVVPEQQASRGVKQGMGTGRSLLPEDADYILRNCPSVKAVSPEVRDGNVTVEYGSKNSRTNVYGTSPNYFELRNLPMEFGRSFTAADERQKARVAVLGSEVREELFGDQNPVGKSVRINGQRFRVIGATKKRGGTGWRNRDDQVTMPLSTAMRRLFGRDRLNAITVQASSEKTMLQAEEEVYAAMRRAHKRRAEDPDDIRIFNQADLTESAKQQSGFLTNLLAGIALVSLIVGGIGIMNIMLVSVTERTREIGIRKALGAKRKDILNQFLIESVTLSLLGGLLGIVGGLVVADYMGRMPSEGGAGMPMLITLPPVLISFGFAALVGIFFGIYPAMKASALDPIQALRYD